MRGIRWKKPGRAALWAMCGAMTLLVYACAPWYDFLGRHDATKAVAAELWKGAGEGMRWTKPDPLVTGELHEYPDIAVDGSGYLWTAWVGFPDGVERIYVQRRMGGFRGGGDQFRLGDGKSPTGWPRVAAHERQAWVAWAEQQGGRFQVRLASFSDGKLDQVEPVSAGAFQAVRPAIGLDREGQPWVAWEEIRADRIVLMARRMARGHASTALEIDDTGELNLRPALARGPGSSMLIAWDHYEEGRYDIRMRQVAPNRLEPPVWVTRDGFVDQAPALLADDQDRVWVAWHTNRTPDGSAVRAGRALFVAVWENGSLRLPKAGAPPTLTQLPNRPELDECLEFVQLARDSGGRIHLFARRGQGYVAMYLAGSRWSGVVDLSEVGWGGRGRDIRVAVDKRGAFHLVARWLHRIGYTLLTPPAGAGAAIALGEPLALSGLAAPGEPTLQPKPGPSPDGTEQRASRPRNPLAPPPNMAPHASSGTIAGGAGAPSGAASSGASKQASTAGRPGASARADMAAAKSRAARPFFGDLHTHTWLSDASGEPDEVFTRARDVLGHDFVALTDHDLTNGNRLAGFEWAWEQLLTNFFNRPGQFATLLAYEWTSQPVVKGGAGHRNIYFPGDRAPLFSVDIDAPTTTTLFNLLRSTGAIAIPHHTSWTGTDWQNFDPTLQPLLEIVSVHGNSERADGKPIQPRIGDGGSYAIDGMRKGYRFGFVGGSDGHGLPWHYGVSRQEDVWTTGMTGIYAAKLERAALLENLKRRRCFATSGAPIEVWLEASGRGLGEELSVVGAGLELKARVRGSGPLLSIELVRDGETDKRIDLPAGKTVHEATLRTTAQAGVHAYYLRVVQHDRSMAWSSPVWVKR